MKQEESFIAFINFLNDRDKYEARLQELTDARDKAKAALQLVATQQGICSSEREAFEAEKREYAPALAKLESIRKSNEAKSQELSDKQTSLAEKSADLKALEAELGKVGSIQARTQASLNSKEESLDRLEVDLKERSEAIKSKESKLKSYIANLGE